MGKVAFLFPGQGAQKVGMGKDIYDASAQARAIFERADTALGLALSDIIFQGPADKLTQTAYTQPALLTVSVAFLALAKEQGLEADYVAGHSLGEFSALVAAGALTFEDAVRTVHLRGQFMEAAVPAGQGAMAAVLGMDSAKLTTLCAEITAGGVVVELANINSPGQIVVSGSAQGIAELVRVGREHGAKRVLPLDVSGPFHSSLMVPAAEELGDVLQGLPLGDLSIPLIANVTADVVTSGEEERALLKAQVYSPVQWEASMNKLIALGVDTFYEIGAGTVLAGLMKKIDRSKPVIGLGTLAAVQELAQKSAR